MMSRQCNVNVFIDLMINTTFRYFGYNRYNTKRSLILFFVSIIIIIIIIIFYCLLLFFSRNQWTGFYIIGTSVRKRLRRSSPIVLHKSVLTSFKAEFAFFIFFLSEFSFTNIQDSQDSRGRGGSLYPFYHFHLFHRHLDISWVIAAESSPLRIAGSRIRAGNLWFTNSDKLGNISRFLLNLIKTLIFVMFKES